jgi:hypothetical protein
MDEIIESMIDSKIVTSIKSMIQMPLIIMTVDDK